MLVAKHHPRYQMELLRLLGSIDPKTLGIWVVKGWNEILSDTAAMEQQRALLNRWVEQDENPLLKRAAGSALAAMATVI